MELNTGEWYLISFLIFIGLIAKPVKGLILSALTSKANEINKDLIDAKRLKTEAAQLLEKAEQRVLEAEKDAKEIIEHAESEVIRAKSRMQKDLDAFVEKQNDMLSQRVLEMEQSAKDKLRENMVDVAMKTATSVIEQKLIPEKNIEYTLRELKRVKHLN